jgi:hypothetical protein
MPDAGFLLIRATSLLAPPAPLAFHATGALPSYPDPLADGDDCNSWSNGANRTNDLMPWYEGIDGPAPFIVEQCDVTVADAAVSDGNVHIIRGESFRVITEGLKRLAGCHGSLASNRHSFKSSLSSV